MFNPTDQESEFFHGRPMDPQEEDEAGTPSAVQRFVRWPRGRHNGRRIVGFRLNLRVDITFWALTVHWNWGEPYCLIGPFRFGAALEFD